jgi:hypothetical protein
MKQLIQDPAVALATQKGLVRARDLAKLGAYGGNLQKLMQDGALVRVGRGSRRKYFSKLLSEKLKDPAFRKAEWVTQGTDEAILTMTDPPYYTGCRNPWLVEFVKYYGEPYTVGVINQNAI